MLFSQTFVRTYHFPGMTGGLGLSKCSDGGFVGTGQHENGPAGGCDIYVYRVSNCGNILWYKTFGTSGSDGGKKVIQSSDGGFLVAGLYNDPGYKYCLMKLDAAGNVQWTTIYPRGTNAYAVWVEEVPFGIATCGWYSIGSQWEGLISFYNSAGSHLWSKQLVGSGHDQPNSIHFSGSNFWVCGGTTSFGSGGDLFVLKLDAAGNLIFGKSYGTSANERRGDWDIEGIPTNDGGYLIAGCTNNSSISAGAWDILLIKINSNGNVVWAKRYGGSQDDIAEGIDKTPDGGFVIVGYTYSFTNGGRDAFLMKVDSVGNNSSVFQPNHIYSSPGNYTVMLTATSDYGCDDTLYQVVSISPPTVPGSVVSNNTVCAINNSGTLNVVGNNGNVLHWEYSPDGGVNWYNISNITTSQTYSNLPVTTIYRAYVKSGGCPPAYTTPNATITVDLPSNAGILLKDTSVCATSNNGTLAITNFTGSVQHWYFSNNNGAI